MGMSQREETSQEMTLKLSRSTEDVQMIRVRSPSPHNLQMLETLASLQR